jgi:uncharacterized protein (DUF927 family)
MAVRILDVPADTGAGLGSFERLHGFPSGADFAKHLRAASLKHYGAASREFLKAVTEDIDRVREVVGEAVRGFVEAYVPGGADGQVQRAAQRFGLIAAAGEVAVFLGILPWEPGVARDAASRCFEAWINERGGIEAAEIIDVLDRLRAFLLAHGQSRFIPAWQEGYDPNRVPMRDVAGYRREVEAGGWEYYVTPTAWKDEIFKGLDAKRAADSLIERGWLKPEDKRHRAKGVRVPGFGPGRFYHVPAAFLEKSGNA